VLVLKNVRKPRHFPIHHSIWRDIIFLYIGQKKDLHSNLCYAATQGKHKMWLLKAGGCLIEVNISTKLTFGNIVIGCLRQVGCLIEVTANTGLTVHQFSCIFHLFKYVLIIFLRVRHSKLHFFTETNVLIIF